MIVALYIVAVLADILSTAYARRRGAREGNPLLAAVGHFWLPVRLILGAAVPIIWHFTHAPDWVLWVATGLYFAVAVSNVVIGRRVR